MIGAAGLTVRAWTTIGFGTLWLAIAVVGVIAQTYNYIVTKRTMNFWKTYDAHSPAIELITKSNFEHNKGRLQAVIGNAIVGVLVIISPFLYSLPDRPTVPIGAALNTMIEIIIFFVEVRLVIVSVREFNMRMEFRRLTVSDLTSSRSETNQKEVKF